MQLNLKAIGIRFFLIGAILVSHQSSAKCAEKERTPWDPDKLEAIGWPKLAENVHQLVGRTKSEIVQLLGPPCSMCAAIPGDLPLGADDVVYYCIYREPLCKIDDPSYSPYDFRYFLLALNMTNEKVSNFSVLRYGSALIGSSDPEPKNVISPNHFSKPSAANYQGDSPK